MNPDLLLLISAFSIGLAGSAHCIGMCGGISGSLGLADQRIRISLSYHLGRLLSYSLIGLVLGSILPLLGSAAHAPHWGYVFRIFTAVLMILIGLQIFFRIDLIRKLERHAYPLWQRIQKIAQRFIPVRNFRDGFLLGCLWGLLPCGLIYSALALALGNGSPLYGALLMLSFGLGTLPAMLSISLFSGQLSQHLQHPESRAMLGILIIILGFWTLLHSIPSH